MTTDMNLKDLDIKAICLRQELGSLNFPIASESLEKVRKLIVETIELGWDGLLTDEDKRHVDDKRKELESILESIKNFDPAKNNDHNLVLRDNLETKAKKLSEAVLRDFRNLLTYLRQETALKSQDQGELARQQKLAVEAQEKYKDMSDRLEKQLSDLESKREQEETGRAELAAVKMAKYFEAERDRYEGRVWRWQIAVIVGYVAIVAVIIFIAIYVFKNFENLKWEQGVAKFFVVGALWYGLSFIIKNYNVNAHLAAVNRHRAAVARTLEDVLSGPGSVEQKADSLKHGVEAMFKHIPIGYVRKTEKDSGNPLLEIINNMPGLKSPE